MLGDLHIHMILDGVNYRSAIDAHKAGPVESLIRSRLSDYQHRGITFLRDGGDALGVSLRAKALAPEYGIDYRSPAFPIFHKGHYGSFIGKGFSDLKEYRRLVKEVRAKGGDFVKIMISGLIDFAKKDRLTEAGLPPEEIRTLIRVAHEEGLAVMAHANGDRAVQAALEAEVESIEHGAYLSEETLCAMAETGTLWVPTLSTIGNLIGCGRFPDEVLVPLLKSQQEKVALAAAQGGLIGLGTDAGAYRVRHGQAAEEEFAYLQTALGGETESLLRISESYTAAVFRPQRVK